MKKPSVRETTYTRNPASKTCQVFRVLTSVAGKNLLT